MSVYLLIENTLCVHSKLQISLTFVNFSIILFLSGIDTSLPALDLARENIVLNNLDPQRITFLREDATEFMRCALVRNELWDIVILDPPKLAPRRKVCDTNILQTLA